MEKTITIKEALAFLNLCAVEGGRHITSLIERPTINIAIRNLFNEDGDKGNSIQINRNKTGLVIGFAETEKPKKTSPPPKPTPSPVRVIKEDDETGGRGKKKKGSK